MCSKKYEHIGPILPAYFIKYIVVKLFNFSFYKSSVSSKMRREFITIFWLLQELQERGRNVS
jgi:hypothetical protein